MEGLNNLGQVIGFSLTTGDAEQHGFLYSGGTLTDLPTLGGTTARAIAINDAGVIAGESSIAGNTEVHAFVTVNGIPTDLGTLGGVFSTAIDINDTGEVSGDSTLNDGISSHAFLYSNGTMLDLGTLGGSFSTAVDLNNNGEVVGDSVDTLGDLHPFLYSNGQMVDLGTLGGFSASASAVNDAGTVVGNSTLANSFDTHAFAYANGTMNDLGTLGGSFSTAVDINEQGDIAGYSTTTDDLECHAFVVTQGNMVDLGTLGGIASFANDINNQGVVVGDSEDASGMMVAFIWENGAMTDLNRLLPAGSDWLLLSAMDINDRGQITGFGLFQGLFQWFLLSPALGNQPPIANAGPDVTRECPGRVTLDGGASSDPDGDSLTYAWTANGVVLGNTSVLDVNVLPGTHLVTLTVTDPDGESDSDTAVVMVADANAPTLACPPPQMMAVGDHCSTLVPDLTGLVVAVDNCDGQGDLLRTQTPIPGSPVGPGTYVVVIQVADQAGNVASCPVELRVSDMTPPEISACPEVLHLVAGPDQMAVVPDLLRELAIGDNCTDTGLLVRVQDPPAGSLVGVGAHSLALTVTDAAGNHATCTTLLVVEEPCKLLAGNASASPHIITRINRKMVPVTVSIEAESTCGDEVDCRIVDVKCNQPITGHGDNTSPDSEITGPLTLNVRAETNAKGGDRIYTITVACSDQHGNGIIRTVDVIVKRGKKVILEGASF